MSVLCVTFASSNRFEADKTRSSANKALGTLSLKAHSNKCEKS